MGYGFTGMYVGGASRFLVSGAGEAKALDEGASVLAGGLSRYGMFRGDAANISNSTRLVSSISRISSDVENASFITEKAVSSKLNTEVQTLNPKDIGFSQPTMSVRFNNNRRVDQLISDIRNGIISPFDIKPIRVLDHNGRLFSLDNRRLLAFNSAGVDKIPFEFVSIADPIIAIKFGRMDPILGRGQYAVVVDRANRNAALDLLREHQLIIGNTGYVR